MNTLKKLITGLFLLIIATSCVQESIQEIQYSSVSFNIEVNTFELSQDSRASKGDLTKKDSDFVNVFFNEVTISFVSVPAGFSTELTINPNDLANSASATLPFGTYSWTISAQSTATLSASMPVYGSGTVQITESNSLLDLLVETDYALVTVQKQYAKSAALSDGTNSLSMTSKGDYYYAYLKSGSNSIKLTVVDNVYNSTIEANLASISKCIHYSYILDFSTAKVQSVSLICAPMQVVENYLIPHNYCGSPNISKDNLIGWYPFCENANDNSSIPTNGVVLGPILSTDRFNIDNYAYSFDGSEDIIAIENSLKYTLDAITISSWIYPTRIKALEADQGDFQQVIFSKVAYNGWGSGFEFKTFGRNIGEVDEYLSFGITLTVGTNYEADANVDLELNKWHHLTYTQDNDSIKFYHNGKKVRSVVSPGMNLNNTINAAIGSRTGIRHVFSGKIDEVGVWNKVLSESEISSLYLR